MNIGGLVWYRSTADLYRLPERAEGSGGQALAINAGPFAALRASSEGRRYIPYQGRAVIAPRPTAVEHSCALGGMSSEFV